MLGRQAKSNGLLGKIVVLLLSWSSMEVDMSGKPIQSPSYPSLSLKECIEHVRKIESVYRTSAIDREDAAKIVGYSSLSGPANKTLAAFASYGLIEPSGKGMVRVTPLAISVIHPKDDSEMREALLAAASRPSLFKEIREQFPDFPVPPEQGVIRHLNRAGFNPSAVPKAAKAFLSTARYVEELAAPESSGHYTVKSSESEGPTVKIGGAAVGDFIQWESGGALQFERPRRVRWVSDDGAWLAVEGSDTGIPMSEAIIETTAKRAAPPVPPPSQTQPTETAQALAGQRKAVFPVSEGDVTFVFPEGLTVDGLEELEMYLEVFLKKEKRKLSKE